jgi:hypothetical protein
MRTQIQHIGLVLSAALIFAAIEANGQIGFPKIPKIPKPTPTVQATPELDTGDVSNGGNTSGPTSGQTRKRLVPGQMDASVTEPAVNRPSIEFHPRTVPGNYPNPNAEIDPLLWTWTPRIKFILNGPVESGSVVNVAYTMPNGSAWLDHDCNTEQAVAGVGVTIGCGNDLSDKKGTTQIGVFGFRITLRNELQGKTATLFAGKFKIEKFIYNPADNPRFNRQFVYYVNSDWKLPIGYVFVPAVKYYAGGGSNYEDHAPLVVQMWFRGTYETKYKTTAHLFYQGKEVASTIANGSNTVTEEFEEQASQSSEAEYTAKSFWFNAQVFDNEGTYTGFQIYRNPGEYEVKVLQNGRLARSAKFSVDSSGNLVDSGIASANKLGTTRVVIPVTVIGDQDGAWNRSAWQAEGFFGNPLSGFKLP